MWPTFYIPNGVVLEGVFAGSQSLCGTVTVTTSPTTVPTPAGAEAGDSHLVFVWWPATQPTFPDFTTDGWRVVLNTGRVPQGYTAGFGTNRMRVFLRTIGSGAPDFTMTVAAGSTPVCYASVIVTNQNVDDPVMISYAHKPNFSQVGRRQDGALHKAEVANSGDLFVMVSSPEDETYPFQATDEPDNPDVAFACTVTTTSGVGASATVFGYEPANKSEANNLLTYCPSMDIAGWSRTGVTVTSFPDVGGYEGGASIVGDVGSGQHYVEQEVTLEAGETYLYALACHFLSGTTPWITYVKPDATEHGIGFSNNTRRTLTGSTEVVWGGAGNPSANTPTSNVPVTAFGITMSFLITPAETGTYKLRVYSLPDGVQPSANVAGSGSYYTVVQNICLQKGYAGANQMPGFLDTTSTPVLPGEAPYLNPPVYFQGDTQWGPAHGWMYFVLRRAGGSRPLCKLFSPTGRGTFRRFSDNTIDTPSSRALILLSTPTYDAVGSSHAVYSGLSSEKFYYELEVTSLGTAGTQDAFSVGFCLAEALFDIQCTTIVPGDGAGQYAYTSTGKTFTNGTQDVGTVATWSAGDKIGAGIDFVNEEITFYRNGTLVKTQSISGLGEELHGLWVAQIGAFASALDSSTYEFTANFKGPFSGRKPTGFEAFDFDNEVV